MIAALFDAFSRQQDLSTEIIKGAVAETVPLSKTMSEQVTALRDWARQRARPAAASIAEYQRLEF